MIPIKSLNVLVDEVISVQIEDWQEAKWQVVNTEPEQIEIDWLDESY